MFNQFQKAINLAKKTGDKLLVFDSQKPEDIHVIMGLNQYEKLVMNNSDVRGLTEQELIDKINRDIAIWKNDQDLASEKVKKPKDFFDFEPDLKEGGIDNINEPNYSPADIDYLPKEQKETEKKKGKSFWQIPEDRKEGAEEIIEEDRQYLEELTF